MKSNNLYKPIVLIAGMVIMLCVGILYMWSVFQPHVVSYGWSSSDVAMTSALMIVLVAGNITGGLLQERVHPRVTALAGCIMFSSACFSHPLSPRKVHT